MSKTNSNFRLDAPLELAGVATSDWQWNPRDSGSDWGYALARDQGGKSHHFLGRIDAASLPSFDGRSRFILDRAKEIGSNAIRLSFDFGRLCPTRGEFREDVMAGYVRQLAYCRFLGLEPLVTLNHWTLPKSFATFDEHGEMTSGPLEHTAIADHFAFYVHRITEWLFSPDKIRQALAEEGYDPAFIEDVSTRPLVRFFFSINEPVNLLFEPYITGFFPPFQRLRFGKLRCLRRTLQLMHVIAYDILHERGGSGVQVGIAHHLTSDHWMMLSELANWGLLENMERGITTDFLGVQHYHRFRLGFKSRWPFLTRNGMDRHYQCDHPDFGQIHPEGVHDVLVEAAKRFPGKQIFLSEFGFADTTDLKRPAWLLDAVAGLIQAMNEGTDVRGAFLWSLTDNFEWTRGMNARFGLFGKDGQRLLNDQIAGHVSSREVWALASRHLQSPTEETAAKLTVLRERAWAQLERAVSRSAEIGEDIVLPQIQHS